MAYLLVTLVAIYSSVVKIVFGLVFFVGFD